ncbi:L-rhamnose-binding lectin CSL3-like [Saccoglossus kowalevskii]
MHYIVFYFELTEVVKVGCFNTNTDDEPIESLECRDDYLVFHHLERELHVEKCAQAAAARGWTTFSLLDGGACHSDADACQNQDNFGETIDCGATGTSSKHTVYEIIQTELVCEHQTLHLECDCGFIHILSANYGRKDGVTCGGPIKTTNCSATTSYNIVYDVCDGEISCDVVAENGVFGDPCVGTFKYLEVKYHCNQISGELATSTVIVCQNEGVLELNCFDKSIHIVSANYGRTEDDSTCSYHHTHVIDTNCYAANSLSIVQTYCEGVSTCGVLSATNVFGTDPCPSTHKYLEVEYVCV